MARDRAEGAALAAAQGADVIVMDDGHQNFALHKDLSLVVVDAVQKFGNGRVLPAGPLREFVSQGLARADGIVIAGDGDVDLHGFSGPAIGARITHAGVPEFKGARAVGFAGIGQPEKFFRSLRDCGAEIVVAKRFADHHIYSPAEIARLKALANRQNALLVTTEKDYVRMSRIEREGIMVLPVKAVFDDPAALAQLLDTLWPQE